MFKTYNHLLRTGIALSEEELRHLDEIISPLIKQQQSPHHICVTNKNTIMVSESTIYRLIDSQVFSARNIDLARKVKFRKRKQKKQTDWQDLHILHACL